MTRRRVIVVICLLGLGCIAAITAIETWQCVQNQQEHARELRDEQHRARDAAHAMGDAGANYIKVHAPWGVFNQISYNFRDREITDDKLRHLAGLTGVVGLDLSENPITDNGLRFVSQVPHLQWLQLSRTNVSDRGIAYLKALKNLRIIDVSCTDITQRAAKDFAAMQALESVYARGTALHDVQGVTVNDTDLPRTWIRDNIEQPLKQEDGSEE